MLSGCAEWGFGGSGSANGTVTLVYALWDPHEQIGYQQSIDVFEKMHPNIKVDIENIPYGSYQQKMPDLAVGSYSFDKASRRLTFRNGPYSALNWIGLFTVEREGKTHRIVLRDKAAEAQGPRVREYANIICTNSTDS